MNVKGLRLKVNCIKTYFSGIFEEFSFFFIFVWRHVLEGMLIRFLFSRCTVEFTLHEEGMNMV